ncbi:MAG TPA: MG2 domain-containing protein, partial [Longimicrobium sp.]|nr:MG2 domain-containing protein [Longimicrobium sp.]
REVPPLRPSYYDVRPDVPAPADTTGLRFRLSEGRGSAAPARDPFAQGRPLTAAEASRLLARLPALPRGSAAADSFAFPAQTFPAPRAGRTVLAAFPPRDTAGGARPQPIGPVALRVARRAPEGEVDVGAEVTITFTQPMVPLASVSDVAAREVPARITPQPAGRWRWIDTRTLKFEPAGRLPMATVYTVEIPAGTRSALGGATTEAERWTFSTPAPQAMGGFPHENAYGGPSAFTPVILVRFDQRVDPAAVLRTVRVRAGGVDHPVRLATGAEVAGDAMASELAKGDSGRLVAFVPARPLPRDAQVTVTVGPGTPSLEGARRTEDEQRWRFRTYGPLRFEEQGCGAGNDPCPPGQPWYLRFNNPLAPLGRDSSVVTVTPALPGMRVWTSGEGLVVGGRSAPNTVYTVRVAPRLADRFGQRLGQERVVTVRVGSPRPGLYAGGDNLIVLDPLGPPEVSFQSSDHRRLRLRLHRVAPADWRAFQGLSRPAKGEPARLPGTQVVDRQLTLEAPLGQTTRTVVDVSPALRGGLGHVVVAIEAVDGDLDARSQSAYLWVQSTRLGVAAFSDRDSLTAWVTSLVDGAPVGGARFEIAPLGTAGTTDARGVGGAPLPPMKEGDRTHYLVVSAGADTAFLPSASSGGYARWFRVDGGPSAAWYTFTDRNLYRPGEEVRFKGWVRRVEPGTDAPPALPAGIGDSVSYTVRDPRGNEIGRGRARLSALGGFDGRFRVPEGTNLGTARIDFQLLGGTNRGASTVLVFQVQEFRRPEYTVSATTDPGPHFAGGSTEVSVRAAYFAGGALPGAPVAWSVTSIPATYSPPGWDEWRFGVRSGGWRWWYGGRGDERQRAERFAGRTDAGGEHALRIDFGRAVPPRPFTLAAQATVTDVNRQTWTANASLLVHPAAVYVGLRTEKEWLERGDSLDLDVMAVDLDGKPVPGRPVEVRATRWRWDPEKGEEVAADSARCLRESGPGPVRCVFPASEAGRYEVVATTTDLEGRPTRTSFSTWVWGSDFGYGGRSDAEVDVVPDRKTYAVGDTARVLLRLPFHPARGLVTVRRSGVVRTETFEAAGAMHTLRVPITEADIPTVHLAVELVGASPYADAGASGRGVSYALGQATLSVPPVVRALTVEALPRDTAAAPDSEGEVAVLVKDAAGRPVSGAEVALVVVDEAVLALTGYRIANPLDVFYPPRTDEVTGVRSRPLVRVVLTDFVPAPGTIVGRVADARGGEMLGGARVWIEGRAVSARPSIHTRAPPSISPPRASATRPTIVPGAGTK